ncbi:3404_t:CDS:2 [Acaulospora morrowiae]|uniref:3404_t:CDS:1 n=1 Tax=Acaulospora morrowiae TaxID=94023 RepID=A0A9N9ETP7_9GLOM|nr:3404_t:CDS:2 [Acaulospora morrowiae]
MAFHTFVFRRIKPYWKSIIRLKQHGANSEAFHTSKWNLENSKLVNRCFIKVERNNLSNIEYFHTYKLNKKSNFGIAARPYTSIEDSANKDESSACNDIDNDISNNISTEKEELTVEWKTLSFYSFHEIPQSKLQNMREEMLKKFREMGIVGRIYIASEGINAQLSCPIEKLSDLREYCNQELNLNNVEFNYSTIHLKAFRKLNVKIRHQIVADGLEPGTYDLSNQPNHLTPDDWHRSLSNVKKPITLIDMRNHYESEVGYFDNAIRPDVDTFRDSIKIMNKICEGKQNEEIYMYCTGGIRCSKAGAILLSNGFKSVNVLKGGITAYGRYISSNPSIKSLYKGRNFTFDKRLGEPITNDIVAQCHTCGKPCDKHTNCRNKTCNLLFIQCSECRVALSRTCGSEFCLTLVKAWDEKFGKPQGNGFDDVKPGGMECIYDHIHRTRPKLVIKRLGGNYADIPSEVVAKLLEKAPEE